MPRFLRRCLLHSSLGAQVLEDSTEEAFENRPHDPLFELLPLRLAGLTDGAERENKSLREPNARFQLALCPPARWSCPANGWSGFHYHSETHATTK